MLSKAGDLISEAWLAFVRRLPCCLCHRDAPSSPHHCPPKGRGVVRDDLTMPVCQECHRRCHGERVVIDGDQLGPVGERRQRELVAITRIKFLDHATTAEWADFTADRAAWLERRGGAAPVPW